MHGDRCRTRTLHHAGEFHGDILPRRVSFAEFDRDRVLNRTRHLLDDRARHIGRGHKRAAVALLHDFAGRAAHVDVDIRQRLAHLLLDPGGLARHGIGLVAEKLHRNHALALRAIEQMPRFLVGERKRLGGNHLGIGKIGAALQAKRAKRNIVHPGHGGKQNRRL